MPQPTSSTKSRRVLASGPHALNRYVAGWRPGADIAPAIAGLSAFHGVEPQPPLGVWMIAWAQKD